MHDWHGRCCVSVPVRQVHVKDAKELLLMLEMAGKLRATAAQRRCGWRCLRENCVEWVLCRAPS